jgi:hypothetical protein
MENFQNLNVVKLSRQEICDIYGGDKFMRDLGYSLGSICKAIGDFVSKCSEVGANNETLMNCI